MNIHVSTMLYVVCVILWYWYLCCNLTHTWPTSHMIDPLHPHITPESYDWPTAPSYGPWVIRLTHCPHTWPMGHMIDLPSHTWSLGDMIYQLYLHMIPWLYDRPTAPPHMTPGSWLTPWPTLDLGHMWVQWVILVYSMFFQDYF